MFSSKVQQRLGTKINEVSRNLISSPLNALMENMQRAGVSPNILAQYEDDFLDLAERLANEVPPKAPAPTPAPKTPPAPAVNTPPADTPKPETQSASL